MSKFLKQEQLRELTVNEIAPRLFKRKDIVGSFEPIHVCAAKVDLRIGKIFLPAGDSKVPKERSSVKVKPGDVFVAETLEQIELDEFHLGIMAPKSSSVAQHGIFLANIGQVDPGYRGHLNFTGINFSGDDFHLRVGDKIASLMIVALTDEVDEAKWQGEPNTALKILDDGQLHAQFGAVSSKVRDQVRRTVMSTLFGWSTALSLITVIGALVIAAVATSVTLTVGKFGEFEKAVEKLDEYEKEMALIRNSERSATNISESASPVSSVEPEDDESPTQE